MQLYIEEENIWLNIGEDMERIQDIYIMQPIFFSFTHDFDRSGGRVMKFTASWHRSLLFEVRCKCKYMH